jgi:hypothetical protein
LLLRCQTKFFGQLHESSSIMIELQFDILAISSLLLSQSMAHRRLSTHQKEKKNVKENFMNMNNNRKLMSSGNDVIANEWNFFCLRCS